MSRSADDLRLDASSSGSRREGRLRAALPTWRSLWFRLHWALGLTAGLVLCVVGLTGALMSYEEAVTAWVDRDRAVVPVRDQARLDPEALIARIEARSPGLRVSGLTLSENPAVAPRARFAPDPLGGARASSVYADPYDGTLLGPARWESGFASVRALHRWLLLPGDGKGWGRPLNGVCTLALLVFLGTGLYLRWPARHNARIWLKPSLVRPGRARWWSLHAVLGTWLLPFYAVIALSGLWWSFDGYRAGATWLLTGQPLETKAPGRMRGGSEAVDAPALDRAWAHFREGHAAALAILSPPGPEGGTIRIRWFAGSQRTRNEAIYDARTGAPVSEKRDAEAPLGRRIADNMLEVHRGRFFGDLFTLLFGLASLALPGFAATGLTLYVLRRRAGRKRPA